MRWFSGSIGEAVASSKSKGAIFVVFIEGPDDVSKNTAAAIESPDVLSKLESDDFVAIKLDSASEEYKQFTEIYRIVPVPSLFFIGSDGRPIEIVAGATDAASVVTRIDLVRAKRVGSAAPAPQAVAKPVVVPAPQAESKPVGTPAPQAEVNSAASSTSAQAETTEDKVAKTKALLEKARLAKLAEEKTLEREREEERRRVGREVQELQRWQQDQEMKQLKEDREREKRADVAARERVREMIQQDKAERAKRNQAVEPPKTVEPPASVPRTTSSSDTARLQLRLPDGSAVTKTLPAIAPLRQLRALVAQQLSPAASFIMSTSFPRRELLTSEDDRTLAELSLVPTSVILVLPSGGRVGASGGGVVAPVSNLFWALLAPVFQLFNYVRSLVFGGGANRPPPASGQSAKQQPSSGADRQGGAARQRGASSRGGSVRQGNVHRLAQAQDSSDDENNTWNGNSTQQM